MTFFTSWHFVEDKGPKGRAISGPGISTVSQLLILSL